MHFVRLGSTALKLQKTEGRKENKQRRNKRGKIRR
jgi:hypothetical protein